MRKVSSGTNNGCLGSCYRRGEIFRTGIFLRENSASIPKNQGGNSETPKSSIQWSTITTCTDSRQRDPGIAIPRHTDNLKYGISPAGKTPCGIPPPLCTSKIAENSEQETGGNEYRTPHWCRFNPSLCGSGWTPPPPPSPRPAQQFTDFVFRTPRLFLSVWHI